MSRRGLEELRAAAADFEPEERTHLIARSIENVASVAEPDVAVIIAACLIVAARHVDPGDRSEFVQAAGLAFDNYAGSRS